jgi:exosortase
VFLAWKSGLAPGPQRSAPVLGIVLLTGAVLFRYVADLAQELFTLRMSMLVAIAGIIVVFWGVRQLRHWWLPAILLILAIPLPAMVLETLALPLQLKASTMGAALLEARHVPVILAGNVIHVPGQSLFVTEACSGLRSLTALLSLGVLMGGLFLTSPWSRALVVLITIPVAMLINGVRVFLTGFLVYFVDPELGTGFMHYTEGWVLFLVSFGIIGGLTWFVAVAEGWVKRPRRPELDAGLEPVPGSAA